MTKEKTTIGPWVMSALLCVGALSYGLLNLPHFGAKYIGSGGYLGILISALFVLPGVIAIYLLARRFYGRSLIEQGMDILGPVIGRLTGFVYIAFYLGMLAMFTRDIINLIATYFLPQTPLPVMVLLYLTAAAYLASRGIETVARFNTFLVLPSLLVLLFLFGVGYQNIELPRLLPIFSAPLKNYLQAGLPVTNAFFVFGGVAMILPYLKPQRSFPKYGGGTLLLLTIINLVASIGVIGTFGPKFVLRLGWPAIEYVHTVYYPYLLLEQAGLLMIIAWAVIILAGSGFLFYLVALGATQLTNWLDYKKWVWIIFPFKFLIIIAPADIDQVKEFVRLFAYSGWFVFFGYPIVLLAIAMLLGKKGVSQPD